MIFSAHTLEALFKGYAIFLIDEISFKFNKDNHQPTLLFILSCHGRRVNQSE